MFVEPDGTVVVQDRSLFDPTAPPVKRVITPDGVVTTPPVPLPPPNGTPEPAMPARMNSTATDQLGNTYFADFDRHIVTRAPRGGAASILAGAEGVAAYVNGAAGVARFNRPQGVAVDRQGNVFVADTGNTTIRKINAAGEVSAFAGQPGTGVDLQLGALPGKVGQVRFVAVNADTNVVYFVAAFPEPVVLQIRPRP